MPNDPLSDRFAQWNALVGGLAHEIKNPLSTLNINLQLLREDLGEQQGPLFSRSVRKIDVMLQESERLERMLGDFLRLTSSAPLDLKEIDPGRLIEDVFDFMSHELRNNNVAVTIQLDRSVPAIHADENLLRQALINLVKNAVDAIGDAGGGITAQTRAADDRFLIEIIDTGCGMSDEVRRQVFTYYFSTKPDGTGLGLPMVRRLVERHRGEITCESAPGHGTRFTIALPYPDGEAES